MSTEALVRNRNLAAEPLRAAGPVMGFASGTLNSLRDLWAHRELLGLLVRREIKARYKDSVLGLFWSLLRPLTMLLIYYVAVGKFLGAAKGIDDFAIYIFTGLTAWNLFAEIVSTGTSSIVANAGLVKKVYLPREVFPLSTTGSALFNFGIQLLVLVGATIITGKLPHGANLVYLPVSFILLLAFATALALLLAAVNVFLRDVQYLVEISLMVLFWASPTVYSWAQVAKVAHGWLAELYLANPMTLVILGFQRGFWVSGANSVVPDHLEARLWIACGISLVLLWLCQRIFTRLQGNFAQEL
jgi:ABC-2 type transport system permease protein